MIISILLSILKIIGIIIISILAFVLGVIILLLVVPIRYKGTFARTGIEGDPPVEAKAVVSWLLHLIHISVNYPDSDILSVRILGIPLKINNNKDNDKDENNKDNKGNKVKNNTEDKSINETKPEDNNILEKNNEEDDVVEKSKEEYTTEDDKDEKLNEEHINEVDSETISSSSDKKNNKIKYTIKDLYDKIVNGFSSFVNSTEKAKKNIHYYHTILTSELFERTYEKCKRKVTKLLHEILPRKCDINLEVGFDDPYTTGEVLALAGITYPILGEYVHIVGNFEENIIRGNGKLSGRIFLFSFLKIGLFYLTDKDLRRLIRLFKKEEKKHGRK